MEMVLMYVVASMSYFRTLVSIPSWATWRTKKGDSCPFLDFFNFSITYKNGKIQDSQKIKMYRILSPHQISSQQIWSYYCKTTENKNLSEVNHLLDFKIEQHIDNILSKSTIGQFRLKPCPHRKCHYQSFINNSFICGGKKGQIKYSKKLYWLKFSDRLNL